MASEVDTVLTQFRKDLGNLRDNDKYKINALTFCARDYKHLENVPEGIVAATSSNVLNIHPDLKLLGLYVIDSIVKNVPSPYRKLYTKNIVELFVHSFQAVRDEHGRVKLFNLRTTWKEIFPSARMYELDALVKTQDPAWPLLASTEAKIGTKSLPTIPKIPKQKFTENITPTSVFEAVVSASRDPRINRKKRSPPPETIDNQYLIDRDGDIKMESVAREQGKKETNSQPKKSRQEALFSGEDQDMRPPPSRSTTSPARSEVWSNYFGKHSELCSRLEVQDIDMRFSCSAAQFSESLPRSISNINEHHPSVCTPIILPLNTFVDSNHTISTFTAVGASPAICNPSVTDKVECIPRTIISYEDSRSHFLINTSEIQRNETSNFVRQRTHSYFPPIRGPVWSVEIDGFPDMINIGVDPRMLSLVPHPKTARRITIDGHQYPLILNRVQPLIDIEGQMHGIRFRCEYVNILIDNRPFTIPGTGYTRVLAASRERVAYLGGPGHELIIDGKPHTIPFNSHLTFINVDKQSVAVRFIGDFPQNVNVLPAIPPRLLKWAADGLFGSPRNLHLVPLNPITELARIAENKSRNDSVISTMSNIKETNGSISTLPLDSHQISALAVTNTTCALPITIPATKSCQQIVPPLTVDVHELFKKLLAAGMVPQVIPDKVETIVLDFKEYSWEKFKTSIPSHIEELYCGYQCVQCGFRFESEMCPEFAKHLDYHYMKNSAEHQDRRSRTYYQASPYWLISESSRENASNFEGDKKECVKIAKCPAFTDPAMNICGVCYEKFDLFWDQDEEEWMLRDAVLVEDKVYHPICQEDVGKEFLARPILNVDGNLMNAAESPDGSPIVSEISSIHVPLKTEQIDTGVTSDNQNEFSPFHIPRRSASLASLHELDTPKLEKGLQEFECVKSEPEVDTSFDTSIPGLSPPPLISITLENNVKSSNVLQPVPSGKTDLQTSSLDLPTALDISSNPLEALKAVLRGGTSILSHNHIAP